MITNILLIMLGLQLKHYLADYVFQTSRMVAEKGDFSKLGGYAHAGAHVFGSAIVFAVLVPINLAAAGIIVGEFVVHYLIDFAKVHGSKGVRMSERPKLYWSLHGLDQLAHQLTYLGMVVLVIFANHW